MGAEYRRYRIEGGDLAPEWAASVRRGRAAKCEIKTWRTTYAVRHVGVWGGEVWPSAWPALFKALDASANFGAGGYLITEAGDALLRAADEVYEFSFCDKPTPRGPCDCPARHEGDCEAAQ